MKNTTSTDTAETSQASWDIVLEHATLGYGDTVVLDDINLTLPSGKIILVLGESGCGKSTLLRNIVGLNRPLSGHIFYGGRDIFALPPSQFRRIRRRFGMLFQDGALLGALTLLDNVALSLSEHTKLPKKIIEKAALRALTLVGLADFADYYPAQLSGGMKKRGGLARAIVTEPPVLFCDEPTSGLDPINAAQMDKLLLDMKAQYPSMTMVLVSHDLASVAHVAEYVIVVRDGGIAFTGTYEELLASTDTYITSFLGREEVQTESYEVLPQEAQVRDAIASWLEN